jgi:core-2/I-Branching enzyme
VALAYVVLAHTLPAQLARLVARLEHPDDLVLIHVDASVDIEPFQRELEPLLGGGRVGFVKGRVVCRWGGPGHLMATLGAAHEALTSGHDFTHLVLLTGQDYPIRPTEEIREFLLSRPGESFLSWSLGKGHELPDEERWGNAHWHWNGSVWRLVQRHYRLPGRKYPLALPPDRLRHRLPSRKLPEGLTPAQGLAYWCLTREAISYCLDYARRRPDVGLFLKRSLVPDEFFFQSVLLSSELAPTLVNEDLRYLNWNSWHPRTITTDDLEPMLASAKLFARKFDSTVDAGVMQQLDRRARPGRWRRPASYAR